ncbi:ATP-binding protein [Castellaniella defragrans]|uniref:C4-dicarboxylate transport sensor protein DctB n=1 Tax=Castellaniella defragrans TaxID=75697 RepID=A0A7W9TN88_CASDE|nr:ATP-binding protein [Castellaniella defragrans]KAB0603656.1 sensor histidine kinase [Castellaniella defragrans]MBB6083860.1 two-component system C4-dicarboxylate transport sensor histidine kinase DctB [Castellaniella defragrans]
MPLPPPSAAARASRRRPSVWLVRWLLAVAGAALLAGALWGAGAWARERALRDLESQARVSAQLSLTALGHKLDKFRAIPRVLAQDTALEAALESPAPVALEALNRRLETLSRELGPSVLYVLDASGWTVAASNWREPDSFVGHDYRFRPYFRDAMAARDAAHFALGVVSHEAGLYLSRRIDGAHGPLGVVVLKIGFRDLESAWARSGMPQFVTDGRQVVLLGYPEDWHYRVARPMSPVEAVQVRASLQFGAAPLDPLPLEPFLVDEDLSPAPLLRLTRAAAGLDRGARVLHVEQAVAHMDGWRLHLLKPVSAALAQAALAAQALTLLALTALGMAGWWAAQRRRRARALQAARDALEAEVRVRTGELRHANERLRAEIDERRRAEARLHEMQDELVQANKLSLLGQVVAGVAHEINQPVGAIRTYADNAGEFLRRGQPDRAHENLSTIARLTERIGGITQELRAFSRKRVACVEAVELDAALDGALMLVGPRLGRQGVRLEDGRAGPSPRVRADAMRLEQVFVNLLHNALEALAQAERPCVRLSVARAGGRVRVRIEDNGPGIDPAAREHLFTPFFTTRAQGVGLGLVISRDILAEFGGTLEALDAARGAAFEVALEPMEEGA